MKEIKLTGRHADGKVAIVDDEDYEWLNQWKWQVRISKSGIYYAQRGKRRGKTIYRVSMHREILKLVDPAIITDHKDGNGLNNQRSNLRIATKSQNAANRTKKKGASKYLGVSKLSTGSLWQARIRKDYKWYSKSFKTEIEAALAYNVMALGLHGEFAKLNIIE